MVDIVAGVAVGKGVKVEGCAVRSDVDDSSYGRWLSCFSLFGDVMCVAAEFGSLVRLRLSSGKGRGAAVSAAVECGRR